MFEMLSLSVAPPAGARATSAALFRGNPVAFGHDAVYGAASSMREFLLAAALDEVDHGMLLVSRDGRVMHANHAARVDLAAGHPLMLCGDELCVRHAADAVPLREALRSALQRRLRKLLTLDDGEAAERVSVSVVPVLAAAGDRRTAALLQLGKRRACEGLSVQCYARDHGLTPAEERVLTALCRGQRPNDIAAEFGVAISTVRTQIGSIRLKTGADSIRALVRMVATLPPLMGVLRGGQARQIC